MTHCKKRKNCSGRTVSTCSTPLVSCSPTSGSMSGRRASWPTASTRWPSPPPHHPSSSSQARWQPCTIETCSIPVTKPKCNETRKKVTSQLFLFGESVGIEPLFLLLPRFFICNRCTVESNEATSDRPPSSSNGSVASGASTPPPSMSQMTASQLKFPGENYFYNWLDYTVFEESKHNFSYFYLLLCVPAYLPKVSITNFPSPV